MAVFTGTGNFVLSHILGTRHPEGVGVNVIVQVRLDRRGHVAMGAHTAGALRTMVGVSL